MTKHTLIAALFITLLGTGWASASAHAQDILDTSAYTLSANVEGTTDYRTRGISRSDGHMAAKTQIQINHVSGLYGGTGANTVDMNATPGTDVEAVLFGGYKGDYKSVEYTAEAKYYGYLGTNNDDSDYWEFTLTGGYDFDVFYASFTIANSFDYINGSGFSTYYSGELLVPLDPVWVAKGHFGYQYVDDHGPYVTSDYADWGLGLVYTWTDYDIDFALEYTSTSLDKEECIEKCGARTSLSMAKQFSW